MLHANVCSHFGSEMKQIVDRFPNAPCSNFLFPHFTLVLILNWSIFLAHNASKFVKKLVLV